MTETLERPVETAMSNAVSRAYGATLNASLYPITLRVLSLPRSAVPDLGNLPDPKTKPTEFLSEFSRLLGSDVTPESTDVESVLSELAEDVGIGPDLKVRLVAELLDTNFIPMESSPLSGVSLRKLIQTAMLVVTLPLSHIEAPVTVGALIVTPTSIVMIGAARGVGEGLEVGLKKLVSQYLGVSDVGNGTITEDTTQPRAPKDTFAKKTAARRKK